MNSYLYFHKLKEPCMAHALSEVKKVASDLYDCKVHIKDSNSYSILLSQKSDWDNNHDEILESLAILKPILDYTLKNGASLEIRTFIDMRAYRERNLTAFILLEPFTQFAARHEINFTISFCIDRWQD